MKKLITKILSLCITFTFIFSLTACNTPSGTTNKDGSNITIKEWLTNHDKYETWSMNVTIKTVVNPALAIVTDKSGSEVNLFGVYVGTTFVNFSDLDAAPGDCLLLSNGKYNEYEGSVEIKEAELIEYRGIQKEEITADFDLTNNENLVVTSQTFDGDVTIKGYNGKIMFIGCTFNGNIKLIGGVNAKVMIWEDCNISDNTKCFILSSITNALLSTNLPKFMIFTNVPEITLVNSGAVVAYSLKDITLNGETFKTTNSSKYIDEDVGEDTIVDYTNQVADMHNVCFYRENDTSIKLQVAIKSQTEE